MNAITTAERKVAKAQKNLDKAEVKEYRAIQAAEGKKKKAVTAIEDAFKKEVDEIRKATAFFKEEKVKAETELKKLSGGSKDSKKSSASQGEVPFSRPVFLDAIRLVLGKKTMKMNAIIAEMIARDWQQPGSNPKDTIPSAVSKYTKSAVPLFEKVGHGQYCVHPNAPPLSRETRTLFDNVKTPKTAVSSSEVTSPSKSPKKEKEGRGCSVCGQPGHNKRGHDKFMANQANGTPTKDPKRVKEPRGCSVCGQNGHNKRTHDKFAGNQGTESHKKASSPSMDTEKTSRVCSVCNQSGHNKRGHDKAMARQSENPQEPSKKVSASRDSTKGRGCSVCGQPGHNKKTHDKVVANQANGTPQGTSKKTSVTRDLNKIASKSPKKEKEGRGCSVCGQPGHNKRGHDKFMANQNSDSEPVFVSTGQHKCSVCGDKGHNKRGHDKAVGIVNMPHTEDDDMSSSAASTDSLATMSTKDVLQRIEQEKPMEEVLTDARSTFT